MQGAVLDDGLGRLEAARALGMIRDIGRARIGRDSGRLPCRTRPRAHAWPDSRRDAGRCARPVGPYLLQRYEA